MIYRKTRSKVYLKTKRFSFTKLNLISSTLADWSRRPHVQAKIKSKVSLEEVEWEYVEAFFVV